MSLAARILSVVYFIRGPTPPLERTLVPWLGSRFKYRHFSFYLPLETPWLKYTRYFASFWLFVVLSAAYLVGYAFLVRRQAFLTPADAWIGCTAAYWAPDENCGLNGVSCEPFTNSTFDFRCPAGCSSTILLNPRAVGSQEPVFVPLIVGGATNASSEPGTYRGDSFLCASAIHAGLISNSKGGCASVSLIGNHTNFIGSLSHGLSSVSFPSVFPLSFQLSLSDTLDHCVDLKNEALAFNVLITCILFLLLRPKSIILFWCLVCIGYWHISLFSQPRAFPPLISDAIGTFLPCLFICYAFWRIAWRFVLPQFSSMPIERAFWYLAPFWAGVEFNVLTDKIPVDRLVASDISSRPGALVALIIIVIVLLILVAGQLWILRQAGKIPVYLKWYAMLGVVILIFSQLPTLQFRLHHYFAAMLLTPLTAVPCRASAVYQGFTLGMFLNGAAAFDFDAIFQTAAELVRDGALGTDRPQFISNSTNWNASIPLRNQTVFWEPIPDDGNGWDAFSLVVDDVERVASNVLNYSLSGLEDGIPHFFRLAFQKNGISGDYTKAATLFPNGTWLNPSPGPAA